MEQDELCLWDESKRQANLLKHGYDFADLFEVFDGRFTLIRHDTRIDYHEDWYNTLVAFNQRIINVTFTPRHGKYHLISARPASREERQIYHERRIQHGTI